MSDAGFEAPDLLFGVRAIADYLGLKERSVEHMIHEGRLPVFKAGRTVCARRAKILAAFEAMEANCSQ
jgi:excisionase family DNA binding protein